MIFVITNNLLENLDKFSERQTEDLLNSIRAIDNNDYNMIMLESRLSDNILDKIEEYLNDNPLRDVLDKMNRIIYDSRDLLDNVNIFGRIIFENEENIERTSEQIDIHINDLSNIDLGKQVILLAENIKDGDFYNRLGKQYKEKNHTRVGYSLQVASAGGSQLGKNLEYYVKQNRCIVLAIVDSDMTFPSSPMGETAKNLNRISRRLGQSRENFFSTLVLDVHEIENLVLPSEYKLFVNGNEKTGLSKLINIEENEEIISYLKYLDFKEGVILKKYSEDNEYKKYYDSLFDICPEILLKGSIENHLGDDLATSITHKIGSNCMSKVEVEDHLSSKSNIITDYRNEIAMKVFSWGISSKGFLQY